MRHELSLLGLHAHGVLILIQIHQRLFLIEIAMKGHKLLIKLLQYNVKLLLKSNMKLACGGTLSLPAFKDAGVDVRLGTDGAASSGNGLDILAEARLASLVQRHDHWDATLLPASEIFSMATKDSQDWAVWNLDDIRMRPIGRNNDRHIANLVFNGADCLDLWVDGKALRRDGITLSVDEARAIDELDSAVETYYQGVGSNQ